MATVIVYDVIKNHLPQDYQGPDPISIFNTMQSLLGWMADRKLLSSPKVMEYDGPCVEFKLDSTMFNDDGNTLMKHCYDRWVSSQNFDHPSQWCNVPLEIGQQMNFNGFEEMYKAMQGDPHYTAGQPNLEDTYKEETPKMEIEFTAENIFKLFTKDDRIITENRQPLRPIRKFKRTNNKTLNMFLEN